MLLWKSIDWCYLRIRRINNFGESTNSGNRKIREIRKFRESKNSGNRDIRGIENFGGSTSETNSPVRLSNASRPVKIVFFKSCTFSFLYCINFKLLIESDNTFISITNHSEIRHCLLLRNALHINIRPFKSKTQYVLGDKTSIYYQLRNIVLRNACCMGSSHIWGVRIALVENHLGISKLMLLLGIDLGSI